MEDIDNTKNSPPTPEGFDNLTFDLKGEDSCIYYIKIKKEEESLSIQAFDKEKIERNDYIKKFTKEDFFKINKTFRQYDNITEILELFDYAEKDKRLSIVKEKNIIVIKIKLYSQKKGFDEARIELPQIKLENEDLFIRFFDKVNELNPFIKEMEKMKEDLELTKKNNYEKYDNEMKKINETITNLQNLMNKNNEDLKKKDEEIKNESNKKITDVNNIINELKKKDEEIKNESNKKITDVNNIISELKKKDEEIKNESNKKIADINNIINELKKKDEEQQNIINDLKKKIEELEKKIPEPAKPA